MYCKHLYKYIFSIYDFPKFFFDTSLEYLMNLLFNIDSNILLILIIY